MAVATMQFSPGAGGVTMNSDHGKFNLGGVGPGVHPSRFLNPYNRVNRPQFQVKNIGSKGPAQRNSRHGMGPVSY